jgi:hypothetical protein
MKLIVSLVTSGYEIKFYLRKIDSSSEHIAIMVEFIGDHHYSILPIRSISNKMFLNDLEKLCIYLENHVSSINKNSSHVSEPFLAYGTVFRIKAMEGEARSNSEGEFSIQCMVNAGNPPGQIFSTYLGGLAVISIKNANEFTNTLREAILGFRGN